MTHAVIIKDGEDQFQPYFDVGLKLIQTLNTKDYAHFILLVHSCNIFSELFLLPNYFLKNCEADSKTKNHSKEAF